MFSVLPTAPEILTLSPLEQIAPEARPFLLDCSIYAYPSADLIWLKDGAQIIDGSAQTVLNNGSLYFEQLYRAAAGKYQCRANNSIGTYLSPEITVTVACKQWF